MKFPQIFLALFLALLLVPLADLHAQGININFGTSPRARYLYNVGNVPGGEGEVIGTRIANNFCAKAGGGVVYFDIENEILFERPSSTQNLINIEYFDDSEREIKLIYDAQDEVDKECATTIKTTGTNTWKSASLMLDDAFFGDRQEYHADFRLVCADTMTIDVVRVVPIDFYIDFGVENEEALIYYIEGGDSQTEIITAGGEECITTIVEHNYIYCNIDDDEIFEGDIPDYFISVEYFDTLATHQVRLQYDSEDEAYKSLEWAACRGWGSFKTYTWEIQDGYMANRENGGADFRINVEHPGMPINRVMLGLLDYGMPSKVENNTLTVNDFTLEQNYPNPFNPATTIRYNVAQPGMTSLQIFNVQGELVRTLVDGVQQAGSYTQEWDGIDNNGFAAASGIYVYQYRTGDLILSKKMTLLK